MKNFGSISEYYSERLSDLLNAYFSYIRQCPQISMPDVFKKIVDMPASRFWVSETRAAVVVAKILKGDNLNYMQPTKREMYFEIYRRFLIEKEKNPNQSISKVVAAVVEQPAPKFYLAPGSARVMILKARKKWYEERRKKLYRLL